MAPFRLPLRAAIRECAAMGWPRVVLAIPRGELSDAD